MWLFGLSCLIGSLAPTFKGWSHILIFQVSEYEMSNLLQRANLNVLKAKVFQSGPWDMVTFGNLRHSDCTTLVHILILDISMTFSTLPMCQSEAPSDSVYWLVDLIIQAANDHSPLLLSNSQTTAKQNINLRPFHLSG